MSALPLISCQYSTFQNASQYDFRNVMISYGVCRVDIDKSSSHLNLTTRITPDLKLILLNEPLPHPNTDQRYRRTQNRAPNQIHYGDQYGPTL